MYDKKLISAFMLPLSISHALVPFSVCMINKQKMYGGLC